MDNHALTRNEASVAGFESGVPGVTPPSSGNGRQGVFLTDLIVELGFADKEGIDKAEDAARVSGKTVEQLLLDRGTIDEDQLALAIAERNGLDHVDLERFAVDMRAAESIGRSVTARCGAVPIAFSSDGALIVAVQDPLDSLALRRIETATGREVRPAIAAASAIKRLIEQLPDEPPAQTPEAEVPRIKSQRELQVDGSEGSEPEAAARQTDEERRNEEPSRDEELSSFDGLSMDLGPMTMEPRKEKPTAASGPDDLEEAGEREERLARELTEAKERVAELELRLKEAVDAAEEATATSEKLRALRRAVDGP